MQKKNKEDADVEEEEERIKKKIKKQTEKQKCYIVLLKNGRINK